MEGNILNVLRVKDVAKKLSVHRTTVYALMRETEFPKPISLGGKAVGWVEEEVDKWIARQMAARSEK